LSVDRVPARTAGVFNDSLGGVAKTVRKI